MPSLTMQEIAESIAALRQAVDEQMSDPRVRASPRREIVQDLATELDKRLVMAREAAAGTSGDLATVWSIWVRDSIGTTLSSLTRELDPIVTDVPMGRCSYEIDGIPGVFISTQAACSSIPGSSWVEIEEDDPGAPEPIPGESVPSPL
jgi:hypothetical protein